MESSRLIKFRAWDKRKQEMHYTTIDKTVWAGGRGASVNTDKGQVAGDCIPLEFTGLLDKNGKEIYEGDIVKYHDICSDSYMLGGEKTIGQINQIQSRCQFMPQEIKKNHKGGHYITHWDDMREIEVIGNIFQDKELLNDNA